VEASETGNAAGHRARRREGAGPTSRRKENRMSQKLVNGTMYGNDKK
jgi:hypothetical protein